jgi:hypothetical protein
MVTRLISKLIYGIFTDKQANLSYNITYQAITTIYDRQYLGLKAQSGSKIGLAALPRL